MDTFTELLQRLRAPDTKQLKSRRRCVKANLSKKEERSVAPSKEMAALVRMWIDEEPNKAVESVDVKHLAPPQPSIIQPAPTFSATPRSAFAPHVNELPRLLESTIGADASARSDVTACIGSQPFSCVVIDLETTGFSAYRNEILEVGCVELRWNPSLTVSHNANSLSSASSSATVLYDASSLTTCDESPLPPSPPSAATTSKGFWARGARRFHRYVRPSSRAAVCAEATAVHGITWDKVKDYDEWPAVARELTQFLHDIAIGNGPAIAQASSQSVEGDVLQSAQLQVVQIPPLVCHNVSFDATFLKRHLHSCGYSLVWNAHFPLTCTMKWGRQAYPHVASSLDAVCTFLGVNGIAERATGYHGALVDATLTARLFLQLCRRWEENALPDAR